MGRDVIVVTSVIPALAEAEDDVLAAQLLLCILQQGDQAETGKERLPKNQQSPIPRVLNEPEDIKCREVQ